MQTELLIARLARQAGPVRVNATLNVVWARWVLVSVVSAAAGLCYYGLRRDAVAQLASAEFLARALVTTLVAMFAARHALRWGVPGMEPDGRRRYVPEIALVTWACLLMAPLVGVAMLDRIAAVRWHPACAWQLATVAVLPASWLCWQLRRAAPYALLWTSAQAALASAAVGALAVQWICGLNASAHHLVWHLAPMLAVTAVLALAGRLLLRQH